ncbi:MAG TPA: ribosome maturation factor RimP [Lachnospiraceae bacterium]|nr:ribosome maturation factor RimP [Lachnospiraceae bacterium]
MAKKSSGKQRIEEEAEKLAASIAEKHGVRIYDVEYVKEGPEYYLNIYIDKDGGVGILDCEAVSRELSDRLDEEDLIREAYTLVVSSPGLGRALTKDRHLQNSIGEKVEGKLYKSDPEIGGKDFEGILRAWDKETVTIETEPVHKAAGKNKKDAQKQEISDDEPVTMVISRKNIAVLRLYLDL